MKRLKAIAGILAIFILGTMTGVLGTGLVVKHRMESFHEKGFPPIRPMLMKRIVNRLDLTPDQQVEVEKIISNLQADLRNARRDFHPKIKAAFDSCFEQIGGLLTEPQKKKLDRIRKELPKHFPPGKNFRRHHKKHPNHHTDIQKNHQPDLQPDHPKKIKQASEGW